MRNPGEFQLSAAERELLPSDEEVSQYAARGWYLSRKLLEDDECDALAAASERFYAKPATTARSRYGHRTWRTGSRHRGRCSGTMTTSTTSATR